MTEAGTVYDLEGNRIGRSPDVVAEFLEALAEALADGPCFVLASPQLPPAFLESLRRFAPVVLDDAMAAGRAEIVEGAP